MTLHMSSSEPRGVREPSRSRPNEAQSAVSWLSEDASFGAYTLSDAPFAILESPPCAACFAFLMPIDSSVSHSPALSFSPEPTFPPRFWNSSRLGGALTARGFWRRSSSHEIHFPDGLYLFPLPLILRMVGNSIRGGGVCDILAPADRRRESAVSVGSQRVGVSDAAVKY